MREFVLRRGYKIIGYEDYLKNYNWFLKFFLILNGTSGICEIRRYFLDIINDKGEVRRIWVNEKLQT